MALAACASTPLSMVRRKCCFKFDPKIGVYGFTYDPSIGEFILTHKDMKIPPKSKCYSVNEAYYNYWVQFGVFLGLTL